MLGSDSGAHADHTNIDISMAPVGNSAFYEFIYEKVTDGLTAAESVTPELFRGIELPSVMQSVVGHFAAVSSPSLFDILHCPLVSLGWCRRHITVEEQI